LPADAGCFAYREVWRTHQLQSNVGADGHDNRLRSAPP
jgi:hypothetical protein